MHETNNGYNDIPNLDIFESSRDKRHLFTQNKILEIIVREFSLKKTLDFIVIEIEKLLDNLRGSILLIDNTGKHLIHGAAPNLPKLYCDAINGMSIGVNAGSCGTAAYRKETIIVEDIANNKLWKDFKKLALTHNLRSCWSIPIFDIDENVLGTFALYYDKPNHPSEWDLKVMKSVAHLASLAIKKYNTQQLRNLRNKQQKIIENERKKIAREIHDELGHSLTAIKLDLTSIEKSIVNAGQNMNAKIKLIYSHIEESLETVRRVSSELRPQVLDIMGFCNALQWQVDNFIDKTNISCRLRVSSEDIKLDPDLSIDLFRIFQEALTNISRHSMAKNVNVFFHETKTEYRLIIDDDGIGINSDKINDLKSLGLLGIRERVLIWKGHFSIKGTTGNGTQLLITIPKVVNE
ncbi:MAG: GAF domain-containing sensor histidine kinase [Nitrospinae bacterium]|nr:GAF domain-containing sensor histidine kinase [Nitrospinota bacterium]